MSLLSAGATSLYHGLLDWNIMLLLLPAGIIASFIARWITTRFSDQSLLKAFIFSASIVVSLLIWDMLD